MEKFKALYPFDPDKSEVSKRWSKKEDTDLRAAVNCSVCKLNEHKEKNHFFNFIFNDELTSFFLSGANLVSRTPPRRLKISTQTLLEDIAKGLG